MANTIIYALLGGVLPALIWLFFWLSEDAKRPEPRGRIAETFLLGMIAVIAVLPVQKLIAREFPGLGFTTFTLWAVAEECLKFLAAFVIALRSQDDDEPIDTLIYMITAALGFVALENTLFIWNPLLSQDTIAAFSTGSMRFIGASILHVLASGTVGFALALSFYKGKLSKIFYGFAGLVVAVAVHTAFNLFILRDIGSETLETFATVWVGAALLLLIFEKVKTIAPTQSQDIINT